MAKGNELKKEIADRIKAALSDCFVAEVDKKLYFEGKENGETLQVAISMTCPKTLIEKDGSTAAPFDWSGSGSMPASPQEPPKMEISDEDSKEVERLMKELGII